MKYLIGLIALLLPTYLIRFSVLGVPTTLLELLIYTVFICGVVRLGYVHLLKCKRSVWLPVGLLFLAALMSVFVAPEKTVALGQFKALFLDPILIFFVIVCYLEPKDIKWTIYGLTLSGVFVSVYSIIQQIMGHVTVDGRVIGIFGYSPNYVALYLVPIVVILTTYNLQLTTKLKEKKNLWLFVVGCLLSAIIIYALYLTGSRAGLLATASGIIFFLILYFWSKIRAKLAYKISLVILIIAAISGTWFLFRPDFNASGGRVVSSNNVRWQIWQTSIEMIKKQPVFGVGLGNYQAAFSELTKDRVNFKEYISPLALSPHNVFLMFYLSTGLLGFLGFVWLLIIFYRTGFSEFKNDWSKILMAAMTTLVLQGLVDTPYFKNDLALIFWLIWGSMLVIIKRMKTPTAWPRG